MNIKKEDKMEQLEFKGTQGEWKLFIDNVIKSEIFIMAGKIPIIRIAVNNYINKKEAKANAKLIEAAPELLKSLNNLVEWFGKYEDHECEMIGNQILCKSEDQEEVIQFAMKAINKALMI
tara:strand:+ start:23 stop:382 length:360 start_codon:yes stop_codon:yes gene_type:complete